MKMKLKNKINKWKWNWKMKMKNEFKNEKWIHHNKTRYLNGTSFLIKNGLNLK